MSNFLLIVLIVLNGLILAGFCFAFYKISQIYIQFKTFVTPLPDGKPSPLANFTQILADMAGRSIVATAKAAFMGGESGTSRAVKAIAGDIAVDQMSNSPLGAILSSFPSLKKTLRKNPQLIDLALNAIKNKSFGGLIPSGSNGNSSESIQDKFKI